MIGPRSGSVSPRVLSSLNAELAKLIPKNRLSNVAEWCFTGRVAHVELLGPKGSKLGVGVQFLYYEVPRPSL